MINIFLFFLLFFLLTTDFVCINFIFVFVIGIIYNFQDAFQFRVQIK